MTDEMRTEELRVSEVTNIRMEDIDLEAGIVRIRGKGNRRQRVKWRTVGMGAKCLRAIQRYVYQHRPKPIPAREDRLFLAHQGRPMSKNSIHLFLKRLGHRAGVTDVRGVGEMPQVVRPTSALRHEIRRVRRTARFATVRWSSRGNSVSRS